MWASTRCPFCSSTRNIALGSGSTTRPSTSMAPSFFAIPDTASRLDGARAETRTDALVDCRTAGADTPARASCVVRPQHDNRAARAPTATVPRSGAPLQPGPDRDGGWNVTPERSSCRVPSTPRPELADDGEDGVLLQVQVRGVIPKGASPATPPSSAVR